MYSQIAANKRKTVFIMVLFVVLIGGLGWLLSEVFTGNDQIFPYVLAGSLVYLLISYFASSRVALAMNGAREIQKRDNPRLYRTVENLAITDGLPMPKVYIIEDAAMNAFATGHNPNSSVVCVTSGLLDAMNDKELEGVVAHEMSHIKNYDIRVSLVAFALVAVVGLLADIILRAVWFSDDDDRSSGSQIFLIVGIIAAILAPIVATMIQLAISRKREYLADASGALATRYPEGLASALEKIGKGGSVMRRQNSSTAHLFFANPLKKGMLSGLFSTHPPIQERIQKLREMGNHT